VPQTAKVQQRTRHYCLSRAKQLGDLWIVAPTTFEQRPGVNFFCQIWSSRKLAVNETSKQQKFNNARVIIVLAEQKMGDLLSSRKLAVRETATVQQCTCHYSASLFVFFILA